MSRLESSVELAERSFTLTRTFDADAELVFKLWTDPTYVAQWWGIKGSTNPVCELDVRVGGRWRIDMRTAQATTYRNEGVYREVVENRRLVFTEIRDPGLAVWKDNPPGDSIHTVVFEEQNGRTVVTLTVLFETKAARDLLLRLGVAGGISEGLDRLQDLLVPLRG